MLKWAINEPKQSYFPNTPEQMQKRSLNALNHIPSSSIRSKSTNSKTSCQHQSKEPNKENQITSTPLHSSLSSLSSSVTQVDKELPHILDCFRDLSNIYPENMQNSIATPQRQRRSLTAQKNAEQCYATTLPTLDCNEYSPSCALIPGPLLALRGLGIPDAYFEKPRYLTQQDSVKELNAKPKKSKNFETPQIALKSKDASSSTKSLSSSQMDESTLEHMIDAIIASTNKEHKIPLKTLAKQTANARSRSCSMSPTSTYTPAYDPANDLDEFWWNAEGTYFQGDNVTLTRKSSDHILCTPKTHKLRLLDTTFKRRRQRPVRRKRKLTNFRNTVKKSARKLLRVGSNVSISSMPQLCEDDEQGHTNLSSDSGHNSSSSGGDSSKTIEHEPKETINTNCNEVEITKRRLSFSKDPL